MKIIIFSGSVNDELALLTNGLPLATLHFVAKPLLAFSIEALDALANNNLYSHGRHKVNLLNEKLSSYLDWTTVLQSTFYLDEYETDAVLWLRDDVVYNLNFTSLFDTLKKSAAASMVVYCENNPVMFYQKSGINKQIRLPNFNQDLTNDELCRSLLDSECWEKFELTGGQAQVIDSAKRYHDLSMQLLRGELSEITLDYHQNDKKLIKGWKVKIKQKSQLQNYAYLGDCVEVHKKAQLHDQVILGSHCFIDQYVDLKNSIVMPGIYIGQYLNISDAIVTGKEVIRVDCGVVIPIEDENLISNIAA